MGRELKRVALSFSWPLGERWTGYVNPYWRQCPDCRNGATTAANYLDGIVHLLLMAGADVARGQVHPYFRDLGGMCSIPSELAKQDMLELTTALAGRTPSCFGHDACDGWTAQKKIIKAAGLPEDWGICPTCKGECLDPTVKEQYESWKKKEPPAGPGYQLWETVSEGSPVSPVFEKPEDLARWLVANDDSVTRGTTYDQWLRFINGPGWAPSMVFSAETGAVAGVQAAALHHVDKKEDA